MKTLRIKIIEFLFNKLLKPYEQVIAAQKVLYSKANLPEVKYEFERAFGIDQVRRTKKQWENLVRVYGMETVCKIEGKTQQEVELKMMKFSDRLKEETRLKAIKGMEEKKFTPSRNLDEFLERNRGNGKAKNN